MEGQNKSVTSRRDQMKRRRKPWNGKLDDQCLRFLEVYSQARPTFLAEDSFIGPFLQAMVRGDLDLRALKEFTARRPVNPGAEHPELLKQGKPIEIRPELIRVVEATPFGGWLEPGTHTLTPRFADILKLAQGLTLHFEEDKEMRIFSYLAISTVIVVLRELFEDLYKREFGNEPLEIKKGFAVAAMFLDSCAHFCRGRLDVPKGRINTELVALIKFIREHEKEPLTPSEIREAVLRAGVSVPEDEAFRVWLHRAVKKKLIPAGKPIRP